MSISYVGPYNKLQTPFTHEAIDSHSNLRQIMQFIVTYVTGMYS